MKYKDKVYLARQFRKKLTRLESLLWKQLRNRKLLNLKFRRQHIVLNYVVDFYCSELKLAIEIDGKIHEKQKEKDKLRQKLIELKNIRFVRIKSEEIDYGLNKALLKLKQSIHKLPPPSPKIGEGGRGDEV